MQEKNKITKHIQPPTYLFLTVLSVILLHFLLPFKKVIFYPWNLLGIILLFIGIIINILADNEFKKQKTTVKSFEESTALITNGVFKLSRNPMYLGFSLIIIGITIFMGSISSYSVIIIFIFIMQKKFIIIEERMLAHKFGIKWLEYKQKVRQWI